MIKKLSVLPLLIVLFILGGCGSNNSKAPDVSNVKIDLKTFRFDLDMYAIDTNHIADGLTKLSKKYPDFLNFFLDTVMPYNVRGNYTDTSIGVREGVHEYLTYHDFVHLQDTIRKNFPDTKETDAELTKGYQLMKSYLPETYVPRIMYINRNLFAKTPVFSVDSTLACICLDMFLGPQMPYYVSVGVPTYMAPHLRKNYIPVAHFRDHYLTIHQFDGDDKTLLDMMIQCGKEQYFLHKILPNTPDSVLFGFTGVQVQFCERNEAELYNFFVQNNLLYSKKEMETRPYVTDGPFARGIGSPTDPGNPTPGNVGTWMGYKIVEAYMAQNSKITLKELLDTRIDAAKFLDAAHYRPKSK